MARELNDNELAFVHEVAQNCSMQLSSVFRAWLEGNQLNLTQIKYRLRDAVFAIETVCPDSDDEPAVC